MWSVLLAGVLCIVAAVVAVSAAGRAAGSASRAAAAERGAIRARTDADVSARVARSVTGVDFTFERGYAAESDVSERIRQDLMTAGATAQRINARAGSPRRRPQQPIASAHGIDVWVKPTTNASP